MARLIWDAVGERLYYTGLDQGVLYMPSVAGVPWSGLISVEENPSGGGPRPFYIDGVKYLNISAAEEFEATINAYTYPDEFAECDGTVAVRPGMMVTQQPRKEFGLSYRTLVGNDVDGNDHAYKIHIIYNALAAPSPWVNKTIDNSVAPSTFAWDISTRPPLTEGYKRSSHVILDSRELQPEHLSIIEDILYGNELEASRLPDFDELVEILDTDIGFVVTDHGDGTWTAEGSSAYITMISSEVFQIDVSTAVPIDEDTYTLSSLP
jgi:hypothetical protein